MSIIEEIIDRAKRVVETRNNIEEQFNSIMKMLAERLFDTKIPYVKAKAMIATIDYKNIDLYLYIEWAPENEISTLRIYAYHAHTNHLATIYYVVEKEANKVTVTNYNLTYTDIPVILKNLPKALEGIKEDLKNQETELAHILDMIKGAAALLS